MELRNSGNYHRIEYICNSYCENTFIHAHIHTSLKLSAEKRN